MTSRSEGAASAALYLDTIPNYFSDLVGLQYRGPAILFLGVAAAVLATGRMHLDCKQPRIVLGRGGKPLRRYRIPLGYRCWSY